MPDMELTRQEATALGDFLLGDAKAATEQPDPNASQIAAGKKAFTNLRCISCHELPTPHPPLSIAAPPKADLKLTQGCLSNTPGSAPNYDLSEDQRTAIRSALTDSAAPTPADEIKLRLTQLNCISCHQRDDFGGVTEARDSYFHSTEEALGNEARLPPPLTLTGAKLQPAWMNKVLYDGERVRPYMTTRMPQYGEEALKGLSDLFTSVDHLDPLEFPPLEKDAKPMLRNGAHLLLGDKGLNCIACHNFNGKESPGMKGLDLMTSYQRLQPAWFDKFLRNPGSLRPGIIMPNYWPDGKAVQTDILKGNTEDQLRALWYNFSFGQSARDPSGLRVENTNLIVTDRTRTYRGRSGIAGYRGIAVGYPGGLNYAFNAQTGALSGLWKGGFVSAGWRGQGAGNFNPADRAIQLPQDVPFLPTAKDPWPLHPKRTKENPVNPDPLYPRQYHYAFQGYSLGTDDVPTFQYRIGEVSISETSIALTTESPPILRRTLTFNTPKVTILYFRPLTGKLTKLSDTSVGNPEIRLTLGTAPAEMIIRKATGENAGDELLIKFTLPAGTSTQTIDYALLR
jgi:mono/diheme cytochrome c family protein